MCSDTEKPDTYPRETPKTVAELVEIAGRLPATRVVLAGANRVDDLRLVESARDHGIIDRVILVGQPDRIAPAVEEVGIEVDEANVVPAGDDEQIAAATVELVKDGQADIVLKGNISTPVINRHMLPLALRPTVSLVTVFDAAPVADGRVMILTDAGVTTVCNFGRMVDMVHNAVDVAQKVLGHERPRVAILSANEKQVPSLASTWLGAEMSRRHWPDAVVYGPLSFDLATSAESVALKGLPDLPGVSEVAGRADILVCPGIDAANILYKAISALNKYGLASLASITVGFPVPYIILSRADSLETRLESIALCSVYSGRSAEQEARKPAPAATPAKDARRVLVINPGSTSMKVAVFEDDRCVHSAEAPCEIPITGTGAERRAAAEEVVQSVRDVLADCGVEEVDAIAARGGILPRPDAKLSHGTYIVAECKDGEIVVDEEIVSGVLDRPEKAHASNMGIPVAAALARKMDVPAYSVDPVVVDEFAPEAEISGYAPIVRRSTSHALNVRAVARRAAEIIGRPLEDINLVVAHLGGGITVAAVRQGQMIDNNIALLGGGPFTPQRAGQLPLDELIALCYSGRFTHEELLEELTKHGGLLSYLDTDRMEVIEERIAGGDERARRVVEAMMYQIAKEIGGMFVAVGCDVEAIVLTGGLSRGQYVRTAVRRRVGRLAPVIVVEGSLEMEALAVGVVDVLAGRQQPLRYVPPSGPQKPGDAQHA